MTAGVELVGALYLPVLAAGAGWAVHRRRPVPFAPVLLGVLWVLPGLLALQMLNLSFGWWDFPAAELPVAGMPLALWLGWAVLWGVFPILAFPRLALPGVMAIMGLPDMLLMPLAKPAVRLAPHWLVGEAVALALVLLPALVLARCTARRTHLRLRAAGQLVIAAALFLFLLPELAFTLRPGPGWQPLLLLPGRRLQLLLEVLVLLALPGLSAIQEFAVRGGGTPIPYDPPVRLVTSGIYRFIANPMQLSCGLVLAAWAVVLRSPWLAAAPVLVVAYGAGLAEWDEAADLRARFGPDWECYRREVRNWLPRWRPYAGEPCTVYMAATCGVCRQARAWVAARQPVGLRIEDAEELPSGSIRRMRYLAPDGTPGVDGVRAMARVFEHLHLGWALAGMLVRLPGVWWVLQVVLDGCGFGPREIGSVSWRCEVSGARGIPGASSASESRRGTA